MTFTDTEKSQIRSYLGYPDTNLQDYPEVTGAIEVLEADPAAVALVQGLLVKIAAVDDALDTTFGLPTAGIKSAGSVDPEFFEHGVIRDLRSIGRGLCQKLGIKMDLEPLRDYFGTGISNDLSGFALGWYT